jgi:hypothetical protein
MNKENAIQIMKQIQNGVRGTLEEHKIIHAAIEYLSKLEEPKEQPKAE